MDGNGEFYQFFDGKDLVHHPIESLGFQVLLRRIPENPLIARFDSVTFWNSYKFGSSKIDKSRSEKKKKQKN